MNLIFKKKYINISCLTFGCIKKFAKISLFCNRFINSFFRMNWKAFSEYSNIPLYKNLLTIIIFYLKLSWKLFFFSFSALFWLSEIRNTCSCIFSVLHLWLHKKICCNMFLIKQKFIRSAQNMAFTFDIITIRCLIFSWICRSSIILIFLN